MQNIERIVEDIIDDIEFGVYHADSQLPSENDLAKEYQLSRHDVRLAYDRLQNRGIIYTIPGVGRFVKANQKKILIELQGNTSFTEKMKQQGHALTTDLIDINIVEGGRSIFKAFTNTAGQVVRIARLRIIDGEEAALHTSYISTETFGDILEVGNDLRSMYAYYRAHGFEDFYHETSVLYATLPSDYEREVLKCPSLVPVLVLETTCYDKATHQLVEISKIIYRSDRFVYGISKDK